MVLECVGRSLLRFCLVWGGEILVQRMPCMFVERCFLISFEDLDFLEGKKSTDGMCGMAFSQL